MAKEQHDDHCHVVTRGGLVWRIKAAQFPVLILSCGCGCTVHPFAFPPRFDFAAHCDEAAMELSAEIIREERGIPVAAGSEARN